MNIFVIRVPLSYLNAIEAKHHFGLLSENCILIILYQDHQSIDIQHLKKLVDQNEWERILYLPYNVKSFAKSQGYNLKQIRLRKAFIIKEFLSFVNDQLRAIKSVQKIFIGDFNIPIMRHICWKVKSREIFNIDEGFKAYQLIDDEKFQRACGLKNKVKYFMAKLFFGYNMNLLQGVKYFTAISVPWADNSRIVINYYEKLRSAIKDLHRTDDVYFIGQSLSEIGAMDEDVYLNYLVRINTWFDGKLCYIPHRGDCENKLKKIENVLGLKVINFGMPIEYQLANGSIIPNKIAGFLSSALQNLNLIFSNKIEIYSFKIQSNDISVEKRYLFETYYDYLQKLDLSSFYFVELN